MQTTDIVRGDIGLPLGKCCLVQLLGHRTLLQALVMTGRRELGSPASWRRRLHRATAEATQRSRPAAPGPDGHSAVQRAAVATRDPRYAASATAAAGRNPKPPQRRGSVAWRHDVESRLQPTRRWKAARMPASKARSPASQWARGVVRERWCKREALQEYFNR